MISQAEIPDLAAVISSIAARSVSQLDWGLPEPWLHAEVFAALKNQSKVSGWQPFDTELPYLTWYPVTLPKLANRKWHEQGAFKYVDLCIRNPHENHWCWVEFKVRHADGSARKGVGAKSALDALGKDFVGLVGMDPVRTAFYWDQPDPSIDSYWLRSALTPLSGQLSSGSHSLVSVYLQLNDNLHEDVFSESQIRSRIKTWHETRRRISQHKSDLPSFSISKAEDVAGRHSLIICESELRRI